jgi:hypothetical protein
MNTVGSDFRQGQGFAGAAYALTAAVCGAILTMQVLRLRKSSPKPTGGQRIARPSTVLSSPSRSNSVVTGEI